MNEQSQKLMVGPDEPISNQEAGFLGLQHVLAMDVYVPPVIIAGLLAMGLDAKAGLIQATFLAAGIGTILQTKFFYENACFPRSFICSNWGNRRDLLC